MPEVAQRFAATQAAWRFYANAKVTLPGLAAPLIEMARQAVTASCAHYALVVMDWSNLHFNGHDFRSDRVELSQKKDWGYELLSALVISDQDGGPLAPVSLELRAATGVFTTRHETPAKALSQLDGLDPVMAHVDGLSLGRPVVYIIDREADSVGHYRQWQAAGRTYLVRANDTRCVLYQERERTLIAVARDLAKEGALRPTRDVTIRGQKARQFVGETRVSLHRPARRHRYTGRGRHKKKRHKDIPGPALSVRLCVSEVRDPTGKVLARWLLLSNAPPDVSAPTVALWYHFRWEIESYHKLLKTAGMHVEQWLQDDAGALAKRLAVAAMAAVTVWHLARDGRPQAAPLRDLLVRLSGRQIKRGKNRPAFTTPALLAGLGVLIPMLCLLEQHPINDIVRLARDTLPAYLIPKELIAHEDTG
jgi:DDE family transposase